MPHGVAEDDGRDARDHNGDRREEPSWHLTHAEPRTRHDRDEHRSCDRARDAERDKGDAEGTLGATSATSRT